MNRRGSGQEPEAIVDRVEGEIAVLELDDDSFENVALSQLPEGTSQGDVLVCLDGSWARSPEGRETRTCVNGSLMEELFED